MATVEFSFIDGVDNPKTTMFSVAPRPYPAMRACSLIARGTGSIVAGPLRRSLTLGVRIENLEPWLTIAIEQGGVEHLH